MNFRSKRRSTATDLDRRASAGPSAAAATAWSRGRLWTFRSGVAFLVVLVVGVLLDTTPDMRAVGAALQRTERVVLSTVAPAWTRAVDGLAARSDGHAAVISLVRDGIGALALAAVWSLLDRRLRYEGLAAGVRVFLRYVVGIALLVYGGLKVVPVQFQAPRAEHLLMPLGERTPMALLWAFMGSSPAYTVFAGLVEWVGGALVLWRRTTTLGALIVAGAMSNVLMLNFCYDVPVKRGAALLLLAALVLASRDAKRLGSVLLFDLPTQPGAEPPFQGNEPLRRVRAVLKPLVVALALFGPLAAAALTRLRAPRPSPIDGVYAVERCAQDGEEPSPPSARWHRLVLGDHGGAVVQLGDGSCVRYELTIDAAASTLEVALPSAAPRRFRYESTSPDGLRLVGIDPPNESVELRALDETEVFRVLH